MDIPVEPPMAVVLDTSVIIDALLEHRPRHAIAVKLVAALRDRGEVVLLPMNVVFEITSAVSCEKRIRGTPPKLCVHKELPCEIQLIPIDNDFLGQ